jgi:predicted ester cyclase
MASPDWSNTIEEIITDGTSVACRLTATGTHRGTPEVEAIFGGVLAGIEATGARVAVAHIHMYEVVGNLITSHWAVRDDLAMLRQLTGD